MKFHTEYVTFNTRRERDYVNMTDRSRRPSGPAAAGREWSSFRPCTSPPGVYVNDAEQGLIQDIDEWLETIAPRRPDYRHHRTGETNGDAHLKNLLIGHEVILPMTAGRLDLGPWQQVYYAEFDGRRPKRVIIKVMGE